MNIQGIALDLKKQEPEVYEVLRLFSSLSNKQKIEFIITILAALFSFISDENERIKLSDLIINEALNEIKNINFVESVCSVCNKTITVEESMKNEVNLCKKCGNY